MAWAATYPQTIGGGRFFPPQGRQDRAAKSRKEDSLKKGKGQVVKAQTPFQDRAKNVGLHVPKISGRMEGDTLPRKTALGPQKGEHA